MKRRHFITLTAIAALSGCVSSMANDFQVSYPDSGVNAAGWHAHSVDVNVPSSLTVSATDSIDPPADIVWWEDDKPYGRDTVKQIVEQGVRSGVASLNGSRGVRIAVTVRRFHGMTPSATKTLQFSGVHNVSLVVQVFDASTGEALTGATAIDADVPAFHNDQLKDAIERGATDRVRVTNTIGGAIAGWLGVGPDVRNSFQRIGS